MDIGLEAQAFSVLAIAAAVLLVLVTGGVVYLTAIEWRDRRRRVDETIQRRPRNRRKQSR
ncbi:MAG: hypothetical protein F6J97_08330 [Leptolyngbya sp. SIO4C1]|nr:hypothetical protein [Leptolyngbya sp. SIO4C1]